MPSDYNANLHYFLNWTKNILFLQTIFTEMLQRIQTIFLIIAGLSDFALHFVSHHEASFFDDRYRYIVSGAALVAVILAVVSIFSFRNRKRQILLNNISIIINALLIGLLMYWLLNLPGGISFPEKGIEPVFSLISIIWLLLANIYIRKDERLVKSVDRLR